MTTPPAAASSLPEVIRVALRSVYDPEFGVSVEDLGLIYEIVETSGAVVVTMTLTSMYCPAGDVITAGVKSAAEAIPGVTSVEVNLVWDPIWTPAMLSPTGREQLGWDKPQIEE
jgi:metal-sulfur cluster biosynthetic enzyme